MPRPPAPHGRTGRPPVTSRAQILAAARLLIDRDGWEKLTIRRLAAELGIGATTLYHHIRDKDDLLTLLLDQHVGQIERPELPRAPRDRIVAAATAMHDALAAWPWAAEVLTADGFVGLLDESALWMVEAIVAGADDHGCTPEEAVRVFRSVWYYTVGEVLVRAHSPHRRADDRHPAFRTAFDASRVPHLAAIGERWPVLAGRDTYAQGLRALVDGLLAQAAGATAHDTP
ncbi:TetR/AcrR family transcriptional regulator [Streptomyces cinereospinus]|uniref:TetR/AcrR family transcriptional regulator n=1 Tax=Streptomyces cinereospinus TaxID=285561 RepID=A0ABV5N9Z0_9ACTN